MTPQIALSYIKTIPGEPFEEFRTVVSSRGLNLSVASREPEGIYAALEWLVPTAVLIFISKSYFDVFLREMGKDHYNALKRGIKSLRTRLAPYRYAMVASKGKVSAEQRYSLTFSIMAEAGERLRFKLLIQENLSEGEEDTVFDSFFDFLASYHGKNLDPEMIAKLKNCRVVGGTLLLAVNLESKEIGPVDPVPRPPDVRGKPLQ